MKKSELRKIIREVISEQTPAPYGQTTACSPSENCVAPTINELPNGSVRVMCPTGFILQGGTLVQGVYAGDQGNNPKGLIVSRCVPYIGSPGDGNMAGHGSPDNPFVPGMGFEDQFIDQLTGPGGPFGGAKGGGKGKPIRESKKRRK